MYLTTQVPIEKKEIRTGNSLPGTCKLPILHLLSFISHLLHPTYPPSSTLYPLFFVPHSTFYILHPQLNLEPGTWNLEPL